MIVSIRSESEIELNDNKVLSNMQQAACVCLCHGVYRQPLVYAATSVCGLKITLLSFNKVPGITRKANKQTCILVCLCM